MMLARCITLVLVVMAAAASASPRPVSAQNSCDPSYPDFCIPPISEVGDLDCPDIGVSWITVLPPDPHGLDDEQDGIGCEGGADETGSTNVEGIVAPANDGTGPVTEAPVSVPDDVGAQAILGGVVRIFNRPGAQPGTSAYVAATVVEFDFSVSEEALDAAAGQAGLEFGAFVADDSLARLGISSGWGDLDRTRTPDFGDYSRAITGTSLDGQYSLSCIIVVQVPYTYGICGVGEMADPLTDVTDVASRMFGMAPSTVDPGIPVGYRTDGLWGRLPRLEHLPFGFVFDQEWVTYEGPAAP